MCSEDRVVLFLVSYVCSFSHLLWVPVHFHIFNQTYVRRYPQLLYFWRSAACLTDGRMVRGLRSKSLLNLKLELRYGICPLTYQNGLSTMCGFGVNMLQVCFTRQLRGVWAPLAVLRWDRYKFTIFIPIFNWFAWLLFSLISDRFEGRQTGFSKCLLENSQVEALQFRVWKKTNTWVRECFNWFSIVGTMLVYKLLYAPTAVRIFILTVF